MAEEVILFGRAWVNMWCHACYVTTQEYTYIYFACQ